MPTLNFNVKRKKAQLIMSTCKFFPFHVKGTYLTKSEQRIYKLGHSKYSEYLLLKPQPIEEHQEMIFRGPIDKPNNRPPFNVLQNSIESISCNQYAFRETENPDSWRNG
jgi:hypothetical protein